ncbi:MAG: ABC transporter ATP-binding protein [Acidimicrobiia bacterium]|jgi:osmoprotectant transport system ATP-binding protein
MGDREVMIRLDRVGKLYPGAATPAVGELSLEIHSGEVMALIGPSGCGKTTTLKMINRIVEPTSGAVWLGGRDTATIPAHLLRRDIGYVIQQVGLFPHRTIGENIATVPRLLGWEPARIVERVTELAELVGLEPEMMGRYPAELSGGQQQRAGVARALAADPPVLLMDEPFGAVDPIVRSRLQDELVALQRRLRKTIVFVTHDIDEAIKLGDRMAILDVGGVLAQVGAPEEVLRSPAGAFVEDFLGGERGLKRLALVTVASAPLARGPMVQIGTLPGDARRVLAELGSDWVGVLDGERLVGWIWGAEIGDEPIPGSVPPRPFLVTLQPDATLRQALDAIVTVHTRTVVVVEGDRFLGVLDLEGVAGEVTE